jgi:hypothetical protein
MTKNKVKQTKDHTPKTKPEKAPKAKAAKKAKPEVGDRLPASVDELKGATAGLFPYLFLTGNAKDEIASELKAASR